MANMFVLMHCVIGYNVDEYANSGDYYVAFLFWPWMSDAYMYMYEYID